MEFNKAYVYHSVWGVAFDVWVVDVIKPNEYAGLKHYEFDTKEEAYEFASQLDVWTQYAD